MGRYYTGDIEGKFWFGVQDSNAADRFGSEGTVPNYLDYYFDESNLEDVQKELKNIEEIIGKDTLKLFDDFFEKVNTYNDQIMEEHNISVELWLKYRGDYADYLLGKKIEKCLIENGECQFTADY